MVQHRANGLINSIIREAGAAFSMLALWMLCLLGPLHQTAGLLHEWQAISEANGQEIPASWAFCVPENSDATEADRALASCPVKGVGKYDLGLAGSMGQGADLVWVPKARVQPIGWAHAGLACGVSCQARAPPAWV